MANSILRFFHFRTDNIRLSASLLVLGTLINGILSIVRNSLLAGRFGVSPELDAYFAAFRIPDLIFLLILTGGLSAAFVPLFSKHLAESKEKAWEFTSKVINGYLFLGLIVGIILFLWMPFFMKLLVPGFSEEKLRLTVYLSRFLLLQPLMLGVSSVVSGALHSLNKFFVTVFAPILYNVGIIVGIVFFSSQWGILGVVFGVLVGACMHLLLQARVFLGSGFRYSLRLLSVREIADIVRITLPRVVNIAFIQVNILVTLNLLSHLFEGAVSIFNFAFDIYNYPITIFVVSLITASYPSLAKLFYTSKGEFKTLFFKTLRSVLLLSVAIFFVFAFWSDTIVRYLLQYGSLKAQSATEIGALLFYLNFGIVASALLPFLVRISFILESTIIPLLTSLLNTGLYIVLAPLLLEHYGIRGVGIAFSLALWCDVGILSWIIIRRVKHL